MQRALEYRFAEMEACNLSTALISQCLGSLQAAAYHGAHPHQVTVRGGGLETGAFLNLNWRIPLRPDGGVQLVIENRGRLYFNNEKDFNLDTRVNNLFSAGLAVPIAGRLALKPTWSLFHFRNKASVRDPVARPSFGLTSNAVEMKLEYRFDWLQGQSWAKVLRYGGGR